MTIKTKITRDSRLNPTAVTNEFKEIVTATCDLLGVREPDLIRNAVEKYVREMYAHGDVITFDTDNFHVGSKYITGTIYTSFDRPNQFTLEVISDEEKVIGMSVTFLKSNEELERLQQRITKRFSTINGLGW